MILVLSERELASATGSPDANAEGSTKAGRGSEGSRGGRKKYVLPLSPLLWLNMMDEPLPLPLFSPPQLIHYFSTRGYHLQRFHFQL